MTGLRAGARWGMGAGAVAVLAVAVVVSLVVIRSGSDPVSPRCGAGAPRLTVQGTGSATGTPDVLTVDLGVTVSGGDAHDALAADDATTGAVLAALRSGGVPDRDVQTTGLSLQAQYGRTGALTGYSVTDSVVATLRDFTTAGALIDAAAAAGGNAVRIGSLSFSLADPRRLEDAARHDAVGQAASHAASMAAAAGERLGPVCSITDQPTPGVPPLRAGDLVPAGAAGPSAVPLQPGTQRATAQVTVVYALTAKAASG